MAKINQLPHQAIDLIKLKTVDQLKGRYKDFISNEDITRLASEKKIPHYVLTHPITGNSYFYFVPAEVDSWFLNNYVKHERHFYEQKLTFLAFDYDCYKITEEDNLPLELTAIKGLYKFPVTKHSGTPPAIYFLCRDQKVVYIGQSINMGERMMEHLKHSEKKFTDIYFFPCHQENLLKFETALIRQFRPEYNVRCNDLTPKNAAINRNSSADFKKEMQLTENQ